MNTFRLVMAGVLVVGMVCTIQAEEEAAAKLEGTWEVTKSKRGHEKGFTVTLSKDRKVKMRGKWKGKKESHEGTYSVAGKRVTFHLKKGDKEEKVFLTIEKLTDDELVVERDGQTITLKRKK